MESVTALEELYYVSEMDKVRFVGWTTALARYDFAVVCTGQFFGKVLVVSLTLWSVSATRSTGCAKWRSINTDICD
ncbi:DUF3055 family protein [Exiguobacterium sp. SL14]|nr:SAV0927 family protein [Exiguobacterium sp. SL14]MCY1690502.1 DUF3055 family protein [Exiguobacterium sp. SL14]